MSPPRRCRLSSTCTPAPITSGPIPSAGMVAIEYSRMIVILYHQKLLAWLVRLHSSRRGGPGLRPGKYERKHGGDDQQARDKIQPAHETPGLLLDPADHRGPDK